MAKYRVKTTSFINDRLVHEGDVVDYPHAPSDNLEPLDAEGEEAFAHTKYLAVGDIARQKMAAAGGNPDDIERAAMVSAAAKAAEDAIQNAGAAAGLI